MELYIVSQKTHLCDIFIYLQQIWTNINNLWYRELSMNLQSLVSDFLKTLCTLISGVRLRLTGA